MIFLRNYMNVLFEFLDHEKLLIIVLKCYYGNIEFTISTKPQGDVLDLRGIFVNGYVLHIRRNTT
jgi:hypothetical protein